MKSLFSEKSKAIRGAIIGLSLFAIIATVVPYLVVRIQAGDKWTGITPSLSHDALRYFSRANDVTRGNAHPHNPYFIEHRETPSPTPSWNDAIVALPQVLGLSFNAAYYVNIFFWGILFLFTFFAALRQHRTSIMIATLGACFVYVGEYGDMLRPGAMQIVYPLYALFLIFFYRFIEGQPRSALLLGFISGFFAYFYIYLFMTAFSVMGVFALHSVLRRDWKAMQKTLLAIGMGILVALPHIVHVMNISTLSFYKETMTRIVFLPSRWPQIEAYYYGRWVVIGMLIVFLMRRYFPEYLSRASALFFQCTGLGIIIAMVSNIALGQDFDIAVHVGRFGVVWYLLLGVVLSYPIVHMLRKERGLLQKKALIIVLSGLLVLQMMLNIPRAIPIFYFTTEEVREVQEYAGVIEWLRRKPEAVVLAPEKLMAYIPTLTRQYVLYANHAALFLLDDVELNERLLLSHAFDNWGSEEFVERSQGHYGPVPDLLAKTSRLRHKMCLFFRSDALCPAPKTIWDFVDTASLQTQFDEYYPSLVKNFEQEYKKYHVRYIVHPTEKMLPKEVSDVCTRAYQDESYSACTLSASL